MAGFGDGVEELDFGCAVDGEVVDGFVGDGVVWDVWRGGEHADDGFGVGVGDWFSLQFFLEKSASVWSCMFKLDRML